MTAVVTTNVPGLIYTDKGYVVPLEQAVLAGVQIDINSAFGGGVNPALNTPQGQIATSETAVVGNTNDSVVNLFQQFDPAYASGRAQDALGRIYFITRIPSQPTIVQAVCNGGQGVTIPAGSIARAADGNIYTCTDGGTIDNTGNITLTFACNISGPIACPTGSLNVIARAIPGWDGLSNPEDGVLGNLVESRTEFELRRTASVAKNARGSLPSVLGAVLDVTGVLDAYVTENVTGSPITIRGASIVAKSLYVAAVGGANQDVANTIWSKKAPGCNYNGSTTVTVVDSNSGYSPPLPSYQVSFVRPTSLPILFLVTIQNNSQVPSDATQQVQAAIIAAFAGADGGTRARIGSTVFSSRYYSAVSALGAWAQILSIQVGSLNTPAATFTGAIVGSALTVSGVSGTIAIGQNVTSTTDNFGDSTYIVSGSGLSWVVSTSFNVPSRSMTSIGITGNLVEVNANQVPTITPNGIVVKLT